MSTVNAAFDAAEARAAPFGATVMLSSAVPVVISVSSTPSPPMLMSLPSPLFQIMTSLPTSPLIVSSPRKPVMRSLPSPPLIVSTTSEPTMMSSPASPLIVASARMFAADEVDRVVAAARR